MKLSNLEKETILLYNEAEKTVEIYTHNMKLQNKIRERNREYPDIFKITSVGKHGGMTAVFPKNRISINLKKPISEERSREISERTKKIKPYSFKASKNAVN